MVTLESSKLFSRLPGDELRKLRAVSQERSYGPGQLIFKEGDPGDGVYVVKTGQVQISTFIATGERCVFSRVPPGEVFGEMSLLDSHPRSAGASAEGDTVVFFVPRDQMIEMLKRVPELSMVLVQEISQRLREFNRQYIGKVLQAERMALVGRFASTIVHDLKNPLAIISIAAELACVDNAAPEVRRTAQERIDKQVDRITLLSNDILEFTRGSNVQTTLAPTDYALFLKSIIDEFQPEVERKGVKIVLAGEPPSIKVLMNPHRLSRVFYNLVFNAVDAMPDGGTVTLHFRVSDREIITEVEDSGAGIAPEIASRLFEPFMTFGKTRGTGLGLSIAQKIVEEHSGTISAENRPGGGGAVFSFTLPRHPTAL